MVAELSNHEHYTKVYGHNSAVLHCKKHVKTQNSYLKVPAKVSKICASLSTNIQTFGTACIVEIDGDCLEE